MGRYIDDRFEAEFEVDQSIEAVWEKLQQEGEHEARWLSAWPRFPGVEVTGEIVESIPPNSIRANKTSEPCKNSEIAISLESIDTGTRVLVVQSGFPAWVKESLESFVYGGNQIVADLILFIERGVVISRHNMNWAFPGLTCREVPTGLEVTNVLPGTFADKAGLKPNDLLMTLNGAPVFSNNELQALLRLLKNGDEVTAQWVSGSRLETGTANL